MNEKLTEANFLVYAMHHYDNPQCHSLQEFEEDLKKILYLKKLLSRYKNNNELRERLILNHIIILGNVLGPAICAEILMSKTHQTLQSIVKTFLVYLNYLPEDDYVEVPLDSTVIDVLRKL